MQLTETTEHSCVITYIVLSDLQGFELMHEIHRRLITVRAQAAENEVIPSKTALFLNVVNDFRLEW